MTQTIIPLIWLVLLFAGLIVTLLNLLGSIDDRRYVRRFWPDHTARKRVADGSVRNQIIITVIIALFIMSGFVGWGWPSPRSGIPATLVYAGLIGGVLLLVVLSILERRDRNRLMGG